MHASLHRPATIDIFFSRMYMLHRILGCEARDIRAAYSKPAELRLAASSFYGGPTAGAEARSTPEGDAAFAGTVALPEKINRDLQDLMEEADTFVANCIVAEEFIRLNHF